MELSLGSPLSPTYKLKAPEQYEQLEKVQIVKSQSESMVYMGLWGTDPDEILAYLAEHVELGLTNKWLAPIALTLPVAQKLISGEFCAWIMIESEYGPGDLNCFKYKLPLCTAEGAIGHSLEELKEIKGLK